MEEIIYKVPYPITTLVLKNSKKNDDSLCRIYSYVINNDGINVILLERLNTNNICLSNPIALERFLKEYSLYIEDEKVRKLEK